MNVNLGLKLALYLLVDLLEVLVEEFLIFLNEIKHFSTSRFIH